MDAVTTCRASGRPALGDLYGLLYPDLLQLARSRLRRGGEPAAIDPTALVHESFLRSTQVGVADFADRGSFMAYASMVMRSVLVDAARRRGSDRRGGGTVHVDLDDETLACPEVDACACPIRRVHESLEELASVDARQARVVEMRCFDGLTELEIAEALGIAVRTVSRDWEKAKAYLRVCMR